MLLLRQSKNNLPYDNVLELERVDHGYQEKGLRICISVTYPKRVGQKPTTNKVSKAHIEIKRAPTKVFYIIC